MKKRVAVVGAGIAGLACAYQLQEAGFEVVVYEKETYVGGRMSSRTKDGFVFDLGADHLCDLYDRIKFYCGEFGIPWEKMRFLKYGVAKGGKVVPMMQAIGPLSKLRLAMESFFLKDIPSFLDLTHLAAHDTDNAYDYMRGRVGQEVADYFVDSFSTTYQFHRAKEISRAALLGIMQSIKQDKARWHLHRTAGGMQALPDAFAARLPVRKGTAVQSLESRDGGVFVDGERYDAAVIAAPAHAAAFLYANPTEKQRAMLARTSYAATISVAFRVERRLLPDTAVVWVPFVESEKISGFVNEAMKGDEVIHRGMTLLSVWLHEDFARAIMQKSDEEIFAAVKTELARVCPWVTSADLADHDLQKWPHAMPKFAHGHLVAVSEFMKDGQGEQNVFFCGDYLNGPWTEGALRCGERVAEQVKTKLAFTPQL